MKRYLVIALWASVASAAHAGVLRVLDDFAAPVPVVAQ